MTQIFTSSTWGPIGPWGPWTLSTLVNGLRRRRGDSTILGIAATCDKSATALNHLDDERAEQSARHPRLIKTAAAQLTRTYGRRPTVSHVTARDVTLTYNDGGVRLVGGRGDVIAD